MNLAGKVEGITGQEKDIHVKVNQILTSVMGHAPEYYTFTGITWETQEASEVTNDLS